MPKKKAEADTLQRFESALRRALNTPPEAVKKKAKRKSKRRR